MRQELYKKLENYRKEGYYPFHMPGHKRNSDFASQESSGFSMDITEIEGFDNLHHPEGVILEAQKRAASLYQVKETFFSINGSTAALLAAICASCKRGGKLLMARNCHKAVYHGAYLWQLRTSYLYPESEKTYGLNGGISPESVRRALMEEPGIQAVVITSPTYDGVVSDVEAIAKLVHQAGAVLIVDEAHGAHFKFSSMFPKPAELLGADLVIQSVHKTLPSMTQTALLHRVTDRISHEKLQRFMGIYQSSSPSYVLMASIDACISRMFTAAVKEFKAYEKWMGELREELKDLRHIHLVDSGIVGKAAIYDYDCSKLVFSVKGTTWNGSQLASFLRDNYRLEMEMEARDYVLALTSVCDTKEGFKRLIEGIRAADTCLDEKKISNTVLKRTKEIWQPLTKVLEVGEAMDKPMQRMALAMSTGKISGEFVYLYPPGIPLLVPGEQITSWVLEQILESQRADLSVQGLSDYAGQSICVVKE